MHTTRCFLAMVYSRRFILNTSLQWRCRPRYAIVRARNHARTELQRLGQRAGAGNDTCNRGISMPSRRRLLKAFAAAAALGGGAWGLATAARGNGYYRGPVSDHFDGTRFFNPGGGGPRGALDLLRYAF